MNDALVHELQKLDYAKNVRLDRLIKMALSELAEDPENVGKERPRSDRDVSSVFLDKHLSNPQRLLPNLKQTHDFITVGKCEIEKVCLRGRKLALGEKIILVTDQHGLLEGYVQEVVPTGRYYNQESSTIIIKKCEA